MTVEIVTALHTALPLEIARSSTKLGVTECSLHRPSCPNSKLLTTSSKVLHRTTEVSDHQLSDALAISTTILDTSVLLEQSDSLFYCVVRI